MNYQILAWIGTITLTVVGAWKLTEKWGPKVKWALNLTSELLDVINALITSFEDKKITKQEIEKIANEVEELQEILKG